MFRLVSIQADSIEKLSRGGSRAFCRAGIDLIRTPASRGLHSVAGAGRDRPAPRGAAPELLVSAVAFRRAIFLFALAASADLWLS